MSSTRKSKTLVLITSLLISVLCAAAQVTTGSIVGTIRDQTGALIPNATITVTDTGKGTSVSVKSNEAGEYTIPFLIPGTYNVIAQSPGFKRTVSNNVVLDIDQKARVDLDLSPGGATETVEVTTTPPLIKTDTSELGDVVSKREVQNLPLNGRDFAQLTYLVPGVTPGQPGENLSGSSSFNPRAATNFNALGSQANTNAYLVDGIVDNEYTFNTVMVQPSVESIAEFKVLTGTYSAEYGAGSGVLSVSTRSGSNQLHGEVFAYLRNSALDARNYFQPVATTLKPAYRRGQFGAAVSAPILKDKLFLFADYYGQRSLRGITNQNAVPTAAERIGDFSNFRSASTGAVIPIYDPNSTVATTVNGATVYTRTQFMGCNGNQPNVICPTQLNQVGLNVASIYPLPQTAGSFNNYVSTANQIVDDNGGNARIDYHRSDSDTGFVRFSYEDFEQTAPNPLVGGQGTCCLPTPPAAAAKYDLGAYVAGIQVTSLKAQGLSANETHIFTPNLVNELRIGYARTNPFTRQSDYGHNSSTSLGIAGLNINQFTTGLPNIQIGGSCGSEETCLQGGTAFLPANPRQTNVQFEDTLSVTRGNHNVKLGFRYVRTYASPYTNTTTRGAFTFNDNYTNNGTAGAGGSGLAALLLGFPNSASRNFLIKPYYITNVQYAGFIQDDWKPTPRLTLNLGVRYDVFTPDVEKSNSLANYSPSLQAFIYAGVNGVSRSAGVQTRYNDVGPRVGFAYDISGTNKTIVRGGFGITYFVTPASASDELGQNPPFTVSQTFSASSNTPLPATFAPANICSATVTTSTCQIQINNPFPAGAVTLSPSLLMTTAGLNTAHPAIVSHSLTNYTSSTQTFAFGVEQQGLGGVVEVGYAGSHSVHIGYGYNPDEVEPGTTSTASRRLIQPLNNISTWVQVDPINSGNYNSLQTKYTKRFTHGLTMLMNYTYAKSLDHGGSVASGGGSAGNPQTITNLSAGYGASGFDVKNRFVSSVTYQLPFGGGRAFLQKGLLSHVLGGFEFDAITTYSSGVPFTVSMNSNTAGSSSQFPDRLLSGKIDHGNPARFFDASYCPGVTDTTTTVLINGVSQTVPCAFRNPGVRYGNSARSVLYGPSTKNWDVSLQRRIKLYREQELAFKIDSFNVFNTPNFSTPNSAAGSGTFGKITGTVLDNRDFQGSATLYF
jgi:hypothetical protein